MITFVIPTWKRPTQLRRSIYSIADQASPYVKIIISDHGSDDETPQVIRELEEKYPFVKGFRLERGPNDDYASNFRYCFALPETKWTWTFGDDDLLEPGALKTVMDVLTKPEFDEKYQFMHVSEASRSKNSTALVKGKLIDLCNHVGWIDMTGFITGNIIRTDRLKEAVNLPTWGLYSRNSFVQSCALLEVLHDKECAFYDVPLVRTQDEGPTEDTMCRWNSFNIGLRYHYIDEALIDMRNRGILGTVEPKFFRYLSYFIWDRFLGHIINSYNSDQDFELTDYLDDLLVRCMNLFTFLDPVHRKRFEGEVREIKEAMIDHSHALKFAIGKAAALGQLSENHSVARFDFEYLSPKTKYNPRERPSL